MQTIDLKAHFSFVIPAYLAAKLAPIDIATHYNVASGYLCFIKSIISIISDGSPWLWYYGVFFSLKNTDKFVNPTPLLLKHTAV